MNNKRNPNCVSTIKHLPIETDYLVKIKHIVLSKIDSIQNISPNIEEFYYPLTSKEDELVTGLNHIISILGELQRVESDVSPGYRYGWFIRKNQKTTDLTNEN